MVNGHQQAVWCTAGILRELRNQFIAACDVKPPWSTKGFVHTVRRIKNHDFVSSGIFADKFPDKCPHEWIKKARFTCMEATEVYMVEVIAESQL